MNTITEVLTGIVNRVTYHNPSTGWSVLRVQPFQSPHQQETVTVHQTKVFAGATMEFRGAWVLDNKYGRQFKATEAIEKKPATTAAIEKYLGSGLIKGVGPKTAKKIVKYFQNETLNIFEDDIKRLTEVPGIAKKKLKIIEDAWIEHRAIRKVMMFLQGHGISTLFAVRIYKQYGDTAISMVTEDPYRLANDFYGIGFFSADKVALSIGLSVDSRQRMIAAIKHVLAASREQGHCYLTEKQINSGVIELIDINLSDRLIDYLELMQHEGQLCIRQIVTDKDEFICYYSKTLFYDESTVGSILRGINTAISSEPDRIAK
ncbi:MAG: helix-hairpin-helix domain-containing protein, partial [Gammaproteobacteria bacterium]